MQYLKGGGPDFTTWLVGDSESNYLFHELLIQVQFRVFGRRRVCGLVVLGGMVVGGWMVLVLEEVRLKLNSVPSWG